MKTNPSNRPAMPADWLFRASRIGSLALLLLAPFCARAAERQIIHSKISAAVTNLTPVRRALRWTQMDLAIGLPLRNREALTNLLRQLYDPASTNYHRFITPDQFAERFGPTEQDYQAVVDFARTHGLTVTAKHPNRTLVSVRGRVAEVERAFHVSLNEYQHPKEPRTFFAPNVEPSVELATPVLAIGGLDNYLIPHPCLTLRPLAKAQPTAAGSGPSGTYLGYDFRNAYLPGVTLNGSGQTVGLLEFNSGFFQNDITAYENLAGLPNVPVTPILLNGYNGGPGSGNGNAEVSLDIEMAISMAPGLKGVLVYEGSITDDILNRMATDNLAKQIGASWTYPIDANSDQAFLQMAAQGQSFFNASGDNDAYAGAVLTPADDPNLTVVGGTTLTTASAGGAWSSETVWNSGNSLGTGGGISTRNAIPPWQQGIDMSANQGSLTMRNLPDVAMIADNVYIIYTNGLSTGVVGTSISTPLWAGLTAVINQLAVTNHEPTVGFINPAVYNIGKGSNLLSYTSIFHDITTGNNESPSSPARFSAVPGYDLCTGWGTPNGSNLLTALALSDALQITPPTDTIISGPVGGPFSPATVAYSLTNGGSGSLSWSVGVTSPSFNVSPTNGTAVRGGPPVAVTITPISAATNFLPGSYSTVLAFTNLNDNFVQRRQVNLAVVTPPIITAQPTNLALLVGMTANFTVGIAPNALMYYQWQETGTNLSDTGNVSGSSTSTLTISNVTFATAGTYSVILSNAAGILASSNAQLTIVPSAPVIVQQPTNLTVLPGASASFNVAVVGNTPYSYRWRFNGTNLSNNANVSGATTNALTIGSAWGPNVGAYSVIVSNALGSITSTGALLSLVQVTAPGITMSTLGSFTGGSGALLYSPLAQGKDGNFYGTAYGGGTANDGTVFKYATNGTLGAILNFNGNNGAVPFAGLTVGRDGYLYGGTFLGGTYNDGLLFRLSTSGGFVNMTTFNANNGANLVAGMIQAADGNFYGTAYQGGAYGYGTVFRATTGGTLTTLAAFNDADGAFPSPVLVQATDGNFYGTTENGGVNGGWGTVFKITPSGALTTLHAFNGTNDGGIPIAGLVQGADGNMYGVTFQGGAFGFGTAFRITTAGALTTIYHFTGGSDGGNPWGGLFLTADGNLYGTTQSGGTYGFGTVFRITPAGLITNQVEFDGYNGANPSAALIQATDGNLYGTTEQGGSAGYGAIYRLAISGPLQISTQPQDQTTYVGGNAAFAVATFGASPVFYQWQENGTNLADGGNISGSATATLRITNATLANAAVYSVVVSNAYNSLTSAYAVLQVIYAPPSITSQPASQTRVAGTTATFSVTATGDQPLSYQWLFNGTNLTDGGNLFGSATSTLTITNVNLASAGNYSVVVSNALFIVPSANATLTVIPAATPSVALTELRLLNGGSDGAFPFAGLIQGKDGNLYGTAEGGGTTFHGTIFRLTLSGTFSTLYSFPGGTNGANPYARLAQTTNGNFYGTTANGGKGGYGTLFRMTNSSTVTNLYSFANGNDGAYPQSGLTPGADGNFYSVSFQGGAYGYGSIYRVTPSGGVSGLYEFTGSNNGAYPVADLIQGKDGKLYGATFQGGTSGYGTLFSVTTAGALTTLVSFNSTNGANPEAGVILGPDGSFYGTTFAGGALGYGSVFCWSTNGTLTTLFSFALTNGAGPAGALAFGADGNLYGTTFAGGPANQGTAFRLTTNGVLTTLLWFDGLNGANPQSALVQASDGNFYGTTPLGGPAFNLTAGGGNGTVFRLTVPTFTNSLLQVTAAIACLPYTSSIAGKAVSPGGDTLTYSKISGPAWLMVATNGILTGTPTNSDIGTNLFAVILTDTNGVSASANMSLVVLPDPPASFVSNPFAEPWANIGQSYSASIATNGTAPYLGAGDVLTFGKVSGPAWLDVVAGGQLSGQPDISSAGTNTFLVSVADLGGGSNVATLAIYVNSAPVFISTNFALPAATANSPYSGTIATNVFDPDLAAGDVLAFSKLAGPGWLSVAGNGALTGTPSATDVGLNSFQVQVMDLGGLTGTGFMSINVGSAIPIVVTISPQGGNLLLGWSGGGPPYQVQTTTNLVPGDWQSFGSATSATNLILTPSNAAAFYRIQGQ